MANFPRIRSPGFWVQASTVLPAEFEEYDATRPKLINAEDGSTHAPTSQIVIAGDGMRISGPTRFDDTTLQVFQSGGGLMIAAGAELTVAGDATISGTGTFTLSNGAEVIYESGSTISGSLFQLTGSYTFNSDTAINIDDAAEINIMAGAELIMLSGSVLDYESGSYISGTLSQLTGSYTFETGTSLDIESGADISILNGGDLNLLAGSTLTGNATATVVLNGPVSLDGATTFGTGKWPELTSRPWERHGFTLIGHTYNNGVGIGPTNPDVWIARSSSRPVIRTETRTTAGAFHQLRLDDLPIGQTITQIEVTTIGLNGTASSLPGSYSVYRNSGLIDVELISPVVADIHTDITWSSELTTTVTLTVGATAVVDAAYTYFLRVTHPIDPTPSSGNMDVMDVKTTGTGTSIQQ
jgi:hypothetical protein